MDDWEKLDEISLPEKQHFYSQLNMVDITDVDYVHAKSVCKGFKIKNLKHYHYLYVQRDILLLANVLEQFRKMYLKIYELDHAQILFRPELVW